MKTLFGLLLTLIGVGIVVFAIGSALMPVLKMYEGALNDPLADGPEGNVPATMIKYVIIGCAGIPFVIAGKVFLILAWRERIRGRRDAAARRRR